MKYLKDNKILLFLLLVAGFVIFKQKQDLSKQERLFTELIGTETEFKKLKDENGRLKLLYVNSEKIHKESVSRFGDLVSGLNERIKVLSDATYLIREKARETQSSDSTFDGKFSSFVLNELRFENGPAIGYVLIFKDGRVTSKIYDHEIKVSQVISKDEISGKYKILAHGDYILKSPSLDSKWSNKPFRLEIKDGQAFIDPTEPNYALTKRMQWWNPKLNLNLNFMPKPQPGISVSLMGYGRSLNDQDYKFLDLGASYDSTSEDLGLTFKPVLYRPFENYMPNTYFGPGVQMKDDGEIGYHLGVQLSF